MSFFDDKLRGKMRNLTVASQLFETLEPLNLSFDFVLYEKEKTGSAFVFSCRISPELYNLLKITYI